MKILIVGATGSIGRQVVKTVIAMGHQPRALVRNRQKVNRILVSALGNPAAENKTFELVAERGTEQQHLTPLFSALAADNPTEIDGVRDLDNMPLAQEPESVIGDLKRYTASAIQAQPTPPCAE
ncbi:MAG: NmrA family NAD(P)-binding protein [Rouxiella aceris]|uniref:NmrA family NAD(P)-binding protein n=1 Tax=Rouxiella aceris TaxID=2703884 RepID=UPI0028430B9E|nr:NmrA family NAD(P)-binding protein [Rouxiella aceris]MDR3431616.1 NmrA family NAD(P)-binding protein [Rouxiella aceris]